MKTILLFLTLSYILFALPFSVQQQLCKTLHIPKTSCKKNDLFIYDNHFVTKNGDILLFVNHHEPLNENIQMSEKILLLLTKEGQTLNTTGENHFQEDITSIQQDDKGGIWVVAHWQMEGVYPRLFYSKNGKSWKVIKLPSNQEFCCFLFLNEVCLDKKYIGLKFEGYTQKNNKEDTQRAFKSTYAEALSQNPKWKSIPLSSKKCSTPTHKSDWKITQTQKAIFFHHLKSGKKFTMLKI